MKIAGLHPWIPSSVAILPVSEEKRPTHKAKRTNGTTMKRAPRVTKVAWREPVGVERSKSPIRKIDPCSGEITRLSYFASHAHGGAAAYLPLVARVFSYHFKFAVAEPMHTMSGRRSPLRSATAHPDPAIPPSSSACLSHV